jgi:serine/threonine protein kinase
MSDQIAVIVTIVVGVFGAIFSALALTSSNLRQETRTRESSQNARFEVLGKLRKGGFGAVYKARDKNGKMFAFKFITSPRVMETKRETIPLLLWHENIIDIKSVWQIKESNDSIIHVPSDDCYYLFTTIR